MRSLAGSLADGVLADTILLPPCPPKLPTNIRKARGSSKKVQKLLPQKHDLLFQSKMSSSDAKLSNLKSYVIKCCIIRRY